MGLKRHYILVWTETLQFLGQKVRLYGLNTNDKMWIPLEDIAPLLGFKRVDKLIAMIRRHPQTFWHTGSTLDLREEKSVVQIEPEGEKGAKARVFVTMDGLLMLCMYCRSEFADRVKVWSAETLFQEAKP